MMSKNLYRFKIELVFVIKNLSIAKINLMCLKYFTAYLDLIYVWFRKFKTWIKRAWIFQNTSSIQKIVFGTSFYGPPSPSLHLWPVCHFTFFKQITQKFIINPKRTMKSRNIFTVKRTFFSLWGVLQYEDIYKYSF